VACFAFGGGIIYGLYIVTKSAHDRRHLEPTNCTVVDAQILTGLTTDDPPNVRYWQIDVDFVVPPSFHQAPNTTHKSSLDGAEITKNYYVNQTLPCYVSGRDLSFVSLSHSPVNGGEVFSIIIFSILSIPIFIGACLLLGYLALTLMQVVPIVYETTRSFVESLGQRVIDLLCSGQVTKDELYDLESRDKEEDLPLYTATCN
jgi:hypothetical protein